MEMIHIVLLAGLILVCAVTFFMAITLMMRTKKIYLEIKNIEKQVEGYIEEVVSTEDDRMYQEKQEKDSALVSTVLKEIFP